MKKLKYIKTFEDHNSKFELLPKIYFKIGDKVIYSTAGIFDWEDVDEAEQGGLELGQEVTITKIDKTDYSVMVDASVAETWMSGYHFTKI